MLLTLLSPQGITPAGTVAYIKVSGVWQPATPYIKVSGAWQVANPYIKVSGTWL